MNRPTTALSGALGMVRALSDWLDRGTRWACIALVLLMTLEVVVAVFFRYALYSPFRWAEEVARMAMLWFGMFGIAIALRDGEHIGLDSILRRLHGRAQAAMLFVAYLCVGVFVVVLFYYSLFNALDAWNTVLPALQISWTWSMLSVPVAAAIQIVHLAVLLLEQLEVMLAPGH